MRPRGGPGPGARTGARESEGAAAVGDTLGTVMVVEVPRTLRGADGASQAPASRAEAEATGALAVTNEEAEEEDLQALPEAPEGAWRVAARRRQRWRMLHA